MSGHRVVTNDTVTLTRTSLAGRKVDGEWWVKINGREVGRVRYNDGWVGAYWAPNGPHQLLEQLPGQSRTRDGAVADVVRAWYGSH